MLLDNVRNRLNSGALAAALTGDLFEDRVVQRSETLAVPVRCLWLATANNPTLSGEMVRRTIPVRLDAKIRQPHLRSEFQHPNLREWVASTHSMMVWAMLTLVRAWFASGCPKGTQRLGMYESYAEVIGGILDVVRMRGFLEIPQEQAELAEDDGNLAPLIPLWLNQFRYEPVLAAQLLPLSTDIDLDSSTESGRKIMLGRLLRSNRGRRFDDVAIAEAGERRGSKLWRLAPVDGTSSPVAKGDEQTEAEGVRELGESFTPSIKE